MKVRDLMTSPAITVSPETPVHVVARIMRENAISGLPVVDKNGKLLGIITERDMLARHAPPKPPEYIPLLWGLIPMRIDDYSRYKEHVRHILATNAEQLMTRNPTSISPDDSIERAAELMMKPGHNTLPVVENGKVVGVISRTDLLRLLEELEAEGADA